MRHLILACLVLFSLFSVGHAQEGGSAWQLTPEVTDAYREYALARQRLILYRQVALPAQRQMIADATAQTRLELAVLDRRLMDYQSFLRVGDYSPVRTAAENDYLTRHVTVQRLRQLQDEEIALMRFSGATDELYQYDVLRSAVKVRAARAALSQYYGAD